MYLQKFLFKLLIQIKSIIYFFCATSIIRIKYYTHVDDLRALAVVAGKVFFSYNFIKMQSGDGDKWHSLLLKCNLLKAPFFLYENVPIILDRKENSI